MAEPDFVAVRATEKRFRVLVHEPSKETLDADTGNGLWPADQFTFRLIQEKALKVVQPAEPEPDQTAAPSASKGK